MKLLIKVFQEMAHIHSLKLNLLANETFPVFLRSHKKYMSSVNRISISAGDSSITPAFWSLTLIHQCEQRKDKLLRSKRSSACQFFKSIFVVKKGIKCFQINPASSLKINLK